MNIIYLFISLTFAIFVYFITPNHAKKFEGKYYRESIEIYYGLIIGFLFGIGFV